MWRLHATHCTFPLPQLHKNLLQLRRRQKPRRLKCCHNKCQHDFIKSVFCRRSALSRIGHTFMLKCTGWCVALPLCVFAIWFVCSVTCSVAILETNLTWRVEKFLLWRHQETKCVTYFFNPTLERCLEEAVLQMRAALYYCILFWMISPLPAGPSTSGAVLCLPPGHRRHAEGHGGLGLRARQEAQGDHGLRQTGNISAHRPLTFSVCAVSTAVEPKSEGKSPLINQLVILSFPFYRAEYHHVLALLIH